MYPKYKIYKLNFKQNISYIGIRYNVKHIYVRAYKRYKYYIHKI